MARNNARTVDLIKGTLAPAPVALTDADSIAQAVVDEALSFSVRLMGLDTPSQVVDLLRQGYADVLNRFQYGLSRQVAAQLGALDEDVQAVYVYDADSTGDDGDAEAAVDPMIHLIIWARRKTAALTSLVAALDRALVQRCAGLMNKPRLTYLLDVQIIDDAEVNNRTGYAALLSSTYHRPMQIWTK